MKNNLVKNKTLKTAALAVVASIVSSLNAPQASAVTRAECVTMARLIVVEAQRNAHSDNLSRAIGSSGLGLSFMGGMMLSMAFLFGERFDGGNGQFSASSIVGIFLLVASDSLRDRAMTDELRSYRQTDEYGCIVLDLGRNGAEEFVTDVLSGWDARSLARKYLTEEEYREIYLSQY